MSEIRQTTLLSDANLEGYYRLEDTSDSSGNAITLTNNNTATFTSGKYFNAANFGSSNTNKYLSTTNTMSIDGGACSISVWVKLLAEITTGNWCFVSQGNNTSQTSYRIRYEYNAGTQRIAFIRDRSGTSTTSVTSNVTMGTSNWYHLVLTYNATTLEGYIDNSSIGSTAASGNGSANPGNHFTIGANGDPSNYSSALIDDVAIFSDALNTTEINTIYQEQNRRRSVIF